MNAVRTARPSSSIAATVGCLGPLVVNRRRICSASAVRSCNARAYLIIWSYWRAISSQSMGRVSTVSSPG